MQETLSILVHAASKVGKSTLGMTCPPPVLVLDAEGSTKFINVAKIYWDPHTQPMPVYDGTWTHCIVIVQNFDTLTLVYQWLLHGGHPFTSVVMDSISEIQRKLKKALVGTEQMKMQNWGDLLTKMDDLIRGYRDLTLHSTSPIRVAMFIAETREKNGKYKPYMQGQIEIALPYWMDIVGVLIVAEVPSLDGQSAVRQRQLIIGPNPLYETGERVQGRLPDIIAEPRIDLMYFTVYPHLYPTQGAAQ